MLDDKLKTGNGLSSKHQRSTAILEHEAVNSSSAIKKSHALQQSIVDQSHMNLRGKQWLLLKVVRQVRPDWMMCSRNGVRVAAKLISDASGACESG